MIRKHRRLVERLSYNYLIGKEEYDFMLLNQHLPITAKEALITDYLVYPELLDN